VLAQSLGPLVHDDALLGALEAYLRHNGQIETAAAELNIHRHTMRKRLLRIGELTGRDLHTADSRAELWVALKARELLAIAD
jgi:purine catabolism regulator